MSRPCVSVIMPVRNERHFIERSVSAVLNQDYPADKLEVLVADGRSTDGTRHIIGDIARGDPRVCLVDNPGRIVPTGLNAALARARGDIIIRVDGHCEIAPDYVSRCVALLAEKKADCVGGALVTCGQGRVAAGIAQAQSTPFGVGGAAFRVGGDRGRYVDTLAFGAYRRDIFDRIGGFDEELVRNQDDEFNFRLTQAGGKIWLDPTIRATYFSRASLPALWRQYYQYGLYKVRVIQKRGAVPSWRHLVPALFVFALLGSSLVAALTRRRHFAAAVAGPYLVANLAASSWAARRRPGLFPVLPLAFATLHLAYGLGFVAGLWHWRDRWQS